MKTLRITLALALLVPAQLALASPCENDFRSFIDAVARKNGKTLQQVIAETGGEPRFHQSYLEFGAKVKAKGLDKLRTARENAMNSKEAEDRAVTPLLLCMERNYDSLDVAKLPEQPAHKPAPGAPHP